VESATTEVVAVTLPAATNRVELLVMPLGDSITQGSTGGSPSTTAPGGYRSPLYTLLTNGGHRVRFVGSDALNPSALLTAAGQQKHEGHGSYTTLNLRDNLEGAPSGMPSASNGGHWLDGLPGVRDRVDPDVILLMAGTNDLGVNRRTPEQALAGLASLVDTLVDLRPDALIIVATVVPYAGTVYPYRERNQLLFNAALPGWVAARRAAGRRIQVVDMRERVTAAHLDNDGVHPNLTGYGEIAACWFDAFRGLPLIENWRSEAFGSAADSGSAADGADWDGDGLSNLMEYAQGSDPTRVDDMAAPRIGFVEEGGGRYFSLGFSRRRDADVRLVVETTDSLVSPAVWMEQSVPVGLPVALDSVFENVVLRDPLSVDGRPTRFMRLRAVRP